jgi:hypothetical protein
MIQSCTGNLGIHSHIYYTPHYYISCHHSSASSLSISVRFYLVALPSCCCQHFRGRIRIHSSFHYPKVTVDAFARAFSLGAAFSSFDHPLAASEPHEVVSVSCMSPIRIPTVSFNLTDFLRLLRLVLLSIAPIPCQIGVPLCSEIASKRENLIQC